jgi:hypothetical protein
MLIDYSNIMESTVSYPEAFFLAEAMAPIYRHVSTIVGVRRAPDTRIAEFERRVCKHTGVWMTIHGKIEKAFDKMFETQREMVDEAMNKVFDGIHRQFELMCDDTVAKTDTEKVEEEKLKAALRKVVDRASKLVYGEIARLADECKNYRKIKEENSFFVQP